MSQFPSAPPPGAYVPPNAAEGNHAPQAPAALNPQQQYYQQQSQGHTPSYGVSSHPHKSQGISGMFNQAVTTGKPMFNKLSKQISSKLNGRPVPTPQHLSSFQNYQNHQQQQSQPSPQPQQQQWQQHQGQPQPQPQPNAYTPPSQSSPFPQSNYATPSSGLSGQSNYFSQQTPQSQNSPGYSPNQFPQSPGAGIQQQGQGQFNQGQQPGQHTSSQQLGQFPQAAAQQSQSSEHQTTGVVGSSQSSPHPSTSTPNYPSQPNQQQQWAPSNPATPSPGPQNTQPFTPTPPPQPYGVAPSVPAHPTQSQQQQQQQQWQPISPTSPQGSVPNPVPHSASPPPTQTPIGQPPAPTSVPLPHMQQQQPPPVNEQKAALPSAPSEFVAELPGDMGAPQRPPSNPPAQTSPYQAYQPPSVGRNPSPGFAIPRRAVSMVGMPLADPWSIANAATELPTREFYMIADAMFDALDRRFEPQYSGMIEASKLLESWKLQELPQEIYDIFAYDSYSAFARLWCLVGIPHMQVPCQASLAPLWNFKPQSNSQDMRVAAEPLAEDLSYPTYMPALNRAGWYKYLFLELVSEPESLEKTMLTLCEDYKPNALNQPDLQKRDRSELKALQARATAIRTVAITRVCQETAAVMQAARGGSAAPADAEAALARQQQEVALKMQQLKMMQDVNNMANQNLVAGGLSFSMAAGNSYIPRY